MNTKQPCPGELWTICAASPHRHAVYLGDGLWNVLLRKTYEYSLVQVDGLIPGTLHRIQPAGRGWADQFDALAAAEGIRTTWAREVESYRTAGFAKAAALR